MFNRIVLIGRLTRDPETRTTTTGKTYAVFSIAADKSRKPTDPDEPSANFFNVKVWGHNSEYVSNYLTKGRLVAVDGRIDSRKYIDKDGVPREIWEVTADTVKGLDRVKDDQEPKVIRPTTAADYDPFSEE